MASMPGGGCVVSQTSLANAAARKKISYFHEPTPWIRPGRFVVLAELVDSGGEGMMDLGVREFTLLRLHIVAELRAKDADQSSDFFLAHHACPA